MASQEQEILSRMQQRAAEVAMRTHRNADLLGNSVDLLERGFQLAHSLLADRQKALNTLSRALHKLDAGHLREKRGVTGRDKYLKGWIISITRNDAESCNG